ncbi:HalOD1 output domain-containing protein [Natranaeroarchaeum aerophilus]|uniref:Halobacterial output domain-containing protein n=1 Tax=Natranaeroarchaeum aerophilus TaxID=2917711 RepID=A0AAE3FT25_9EURY|nr:HalOD1 output domain-containing protein [Natranaeroarchaeum aerophilus]MCL9814605.1 hypothetical protein [Natranaeroarchaeum aerophilus]
MNGDSGGRNDMGMDRDVEYVAVSDDESDAGTLFDPDAEDAWIESDTLVSLVDDEASGTRFDAETGTYHIEYDWRTAMPMSMIVVMVVSDLEGTDPMELTPLYDSLDPELLDTLFSPRSDGTLAVGEVTFTFEGYEIHVYRHGHISVRPPEALETQESS